MIRRFLNIVGVRHRKFTLPILIESNERFKLWSLETNNEVMKLVYLVTSSHVSADFIH